MTASLDEAALADTSLDLCKRIEGMDFNIRCMPICDRAWRHVRPISAAASTPHGSSVIDMSAVSSHSNSSSERALESNTLIGSRNNGLKASICLKLTIFIGLLVVLSAGVPALVLWLKTREQLLEEIERRLFTVSTLRQEQLREYLYSETDKTELIGTRVLINNYLLNPSANNKSLAEFDLRSAVEVISDFIYAAIYDSVGQLVISTDDNMFAKALHPSLAGVTACDLSSDPFTISDVAYRLNLPEGCKIRNAFHVSLLRPFVGDVLGDMVPKEQPKVKELDEILVLEQILAHKETKVRGKVARRYLVKFKNYPPMHAKWMEEAELIDLRQLFQLYFEAFLLQVAPTVTCCHYVVSMARDAQQSRQGMYVIYSFFTELVQQVTML
ncbi:hypothetical protein L7F22_035796 [Adiantum nelumboides]|nr:hypothetical protein [Adiantum nelumboides]